MQHLIVLSKTFMFHLHACYYVDEQKSEGISQFLQSTISVGIKGKMPCHITIIHSNVIIIHEI